MDAIMDFLQSWTFIIIMVIILAALVGVFFFLRSRRPED
jgi:hypothetical protein